MAINPKNKKSFWQRPEGITGSIFLIALVLGGGALLVGLIPIITNLLGNVIFLASMLMVLGAILYMVFDPKTRNLVSYLYKSAMRWITSFFVNIDPIGILKNYVEELEGNIAKMNRQIAQLRGQMHKLKETIHNNNKSIEQDLSLAAKAKESQKKKVMILKTRKAGRLKESNTRLESLYKKMEVTYRVLTKMGENSEILKEDIKDQVMVKEQERKAIHASSGAMKSAMSVISGDPDQRAMFDNAMEAVAEDVANKVGEMEKYMEVSSNFMNSVDLKNGIFEDKGLQMLEEWEQKSTKMILGDADEGMLDLNSKPKREAPSPIQNSNESKESGNKYDDFF